MQVVLSLIRCCREVRSQLTSVDCQLIFLGEREKKKLIPASDGFNFDTSPLNCNTLYLFFHPCHDIDFNKERDKACNNIKKPQQGINPRYRGACQEQKHKQQIGCSTRHPH